MVPDPLGWLLCPSHLQPLVKSHEKAEGRQLGNRATGGQGGRGRAGQLAGGGQRAALGDGVDAQRGKGEERGAGKVHSLQP